MSFKQTKQHHNKEAILKKIEEIKAALDNNNDATTNHCGLMGGTSGIILFYLYHYRFTKSIESAEKVGELLNQVLESETLYYTPNYSSGLAGVGWLLTQISDNFSDIIELDNDEIMGETYEDLAHFMLLEIKQKRFDYMHNAMGVALYFLSVSNNEIVEKNIQKFIQSLLEISEIDEIEQTMKWEGYLEKQGDGCYNLGLSHGIPSILVFLCKAYHKNKNLIEKKHIQYIVNFILSCKNDNSCISLFPYSIPVEENEKKVSRFAWCYGDLGIISSLIQANKILENKQLENEIKDIINHNVVRKSREENLILDAGLCHGTAGIAYLFQSYFKEYKVDLYQETANYWIEETLKMAYHEDGLAGYKSWQGEFGWQNDSSFLEGIAGIGLALLAHISDEEPTWDRCLLLS